MAHFLNTQVNSASIEKEIENNILYSWSSMDVKVKEAEPIWDKMNRKKIKKNHHRRHHYHHQKRQQPNTQMTQEHSTQNNE